MAWYYAIGNEQRGPLEQAEFDCLRQQGAITEDTLVWRQGMANWQRWRELSLPPVPPAPALATPIAGALVCAECGRTFPPDQVIRLGQGFACASCKPLAVQKLREGITDSPEEQARKAHLNHESSVRAVGLLYLLLAAFFLFSGLGGFVYSVAVLRGEDLAFGISFSVLGAVLVWTGIGVLRLKPWARILTGIFSSVGLLAIPIGTVVNAYILYLLFSKKGITVFSADYKRVIAETPQIKSRVTVFFWIVVGLMLLFGIGFLVAFIAPEGTFSRR